MGIVSSSPSTFFDYGLISLECFHIISYIIAFIATGVILFRYLKEKYIDLLKIIQLSFIIVNGLNYILMIVSGFINNKTALQCLFVFTVLFETFEAIYLSSQISWFTLALHLEEYRLMVEGKSYIEGKNLSK